MRFFFLSKRKPGKSFQNTSLGNHSLVLARDGKRTEGMQKSELRLKTKHQLKTIHQRHNEEKRGQGEVLVLRVPTVIAS